MDNPSKFSRLRAWWRTHKPSKRRLIQLYAALLTNANLKGFSSGKIYKGSSKKVCLPGLNCYSCPGAIGACPLGALQNAFSEAKLPSIAYVFGILLLFGLLLGRTICGFLCPFGFFQELLHKIPTPKLKKNRLTWVLSYFKYILLLVLVILVPLAFSGKLALPGFCKYICPSGTLFGAIGLLSNPNNEDLFPMLGGLFTWKFCLLILFILGSIFLFRFFCRFFCPLGAIYGFFSKIALLGVKLDSDKCVSCGICLQHCKMDIRHVGDHECIHCGDCISACPTGAITRKGNRFLLRENECVSCTSPADPGTAETPSGKAAPVSKKTKRLKLVAALLSTALLVGTLVYYNCIEQDPADAITYTVGVRCPEIRLPGIGDDADFALSDHRGKIVILNFWATWCGPCVAELPQFEQLANRYPEDVTVAAIHVTPYSDGFLEANGWIGWTVRFLQDEAQPLLQGQPVSEMFGSADALPITVIIGRDGKILHRFVGSVSYDDLLQTISPEL